MGGLAGVCAGDSKISTVGIGNGLNYRGYNVEELCEKSTFEEVFYLLLFEKLPTQEELDQFISKIASQRVIPDKLALMLETIPRTAHPMNVMSCVSSLLGTFEPENEDRT